MDDYIWLKTGTLLVTFVMFVGIMIWAYSGRRKRGFDEAAQIPFREDDDERAAHRTH